MKTPPGAYYNHQRHILSPSTSRSAAISPRTSNEGLPHSPPSSGPFPHDISPGGGKSAYHPFSNNPAAENNRDKYSPFGGGGQSGLSPAEHARISHEHIRKQDLQRVSDQNRKSSLLSPGGLNPTAAAFNRSFQQEYADKEYARHQQSVAAARGEITPRDIPSRPAIYEHRNTGGGHEDSPAAEQVRLLAQSRDRYNMMSSQQQSAMYPPPPSNVRSNSTPPASLAGGGGPSSLHSSNLVLGRADGSILSKISTSNYDAVSSRPPGEPKR